MVRSSAFLIGDSLTFDTWFDGKIRARGNRVGLYGIGIEAQGGIKTGQMLARIRAAKWRLNMQSRVACLAGRSIGVASTEDTSE